MEKDNKTIAGRIWGLFSSIKLAVVLFSLIALTSIVGTILEQQSEPEKNIIILTKFFGESLAPTMYSFFDAMGFLDMYRSWWFVALLVLFASNLIVCSIDRFPAVYKAAKEPIKPLSEEHYKAIPIRREFVLKGGPEKALEAIASKSGFKFTTESATVALWESGRFTRFGVFVTHMSIVLILAGAIIGIFFGFKGNVNVPEGANYAFAMQRALLTKAETEERGVVLDAIQKSGGDVQGAASLLGVPESQLRGRAKKLGIIPLGFGIRCDDFDVSFYGGSEMPKDYSSDLTIIDGGREVLKKRIEVNDPLKYKGITFYQSSYGLMDDASHVEFVMRVTSKSGASETVKAHAGESIVITPGVLEFTVRDWSPSISFDPTGKAFTSSEFMNNPAAQVEITEAGRTYTKWLLKRFPETWLLESGHIIELSDVWGAQYTGLQVRKDPGVWVVYLGCIVLSLGLFVSFFTSHRRIWVRLVPEKGGTKVLLAATANKNAESFERKIDRLVSLISGISGGSGGGK